MSSIGCAACGGRQVVLPIFACAVHEECIDGVGRDGVRGCRGCSDYQAKAITESQSE